VSRDLVSKRVSELVARPLVGRRGRDKIEQVRTKQTLGPVSKARPLWFFFWVSHFFGHFRPRSNDKKAINVVRRERAWLTIARQ
jgi:hypothetical protein